jgi:hypothetical protein
MGERWGLGENVGLLLYDVGVYEAGDDLIFWDTDVDFGWALDDVKEEKSVLCLRFYRPS